MGIAGGDTTRSNGLRTNANLKKLSQISFPGTGRVSSALMWPWPKATAR
jgi:hypothetical protein